jgi:hypothetical protein
MEPLSAKMSERVVENPELAADTEQKEDLRRFILMKTEIFRVVTINLCEMQSQ